MYSNSSPSSTLSFMGLSSSILSPHFYSCSNSFKSSVVFIAFTVTIVVVLVPLCGLVIYVGLQKRRQTSTARTVSHSDFLVYNIIGLELIGLLGCVYYCCGIVLKEEFMMKGGIYILFLIYLGRLLFQCLLCVEQYLAVIHPVVYLRMKTERGIKIRNASIGCIWLLCFVILFLLIVLTPILTLMPFFVGFAVGLLIILFCSMSVLLALIRPGPGDAAGDGKRVHQAKKRAFLNIASMTGIIFLKYTGLLVCTGLHASYLFSFNDRCILLMSAFWFCLPSCLSMPLVFLYRERKFTCFSNKRETV